VKAREGWDLPRGDKHNFLRNVGGMEDWLSSSCQAHGKVRLAQSKSTAYWWIIRPNVDLNSGHYAPSGHVAALYQDELYQMVSGPAGFARLQSFGVIFGCERVVIYVQPDNGNTQEVTSNTARTHLLINNEALNWAEYATEFREHLPQQLEDFQNEIGQKAQHSDHRLAIRERLKTIKELFRFGRYRPTKSGKFTVGDSSENSGGSQATVIRDTVREWFEQQLIETILSAWALRHAGRWSMVELPELWSESALTAAVLPRYHIDINIKRSLGQRLGKLANAA